MENFPVPKEVLKHYRYEEKYLMKTDKTLINHDGFYEKSPVGNSLREALLKLRKVSDKNARNDNKEVYIFEEQNGKIYAAMWKDLIF